MPRKVDSINLYITSLCNYSCLDCCAETVIKKSITPEEVKGMANNLGKINELVITGGEPTLHKHFRDVMSEVFDLDYQKLIIHTNGFKVMEYIDILNHFDEIRFSLYNKASFPDAPDNTAKIMAFKKAYKGKARVVHQHITMIEQNEDTKPCPRGFSHIGSYFMGKVYGCCVAGGIHGAEGVPLTKHWRRDMANVPLPCDKCVFALP